LGLGISLETGTNYKMRLIQISGVGRVGKTTLAHMVCKEAFELGYRPVIIPFADAIKKAAAKKGLTKESNSEEYRKFCQKTGASKRKKNPDHWVDETEKAILEYMEKEVNNKRELLTNWEYVIVQDDVRYMNELAFGRKLAAIQLFVYAGDRQIPEHNAEWRTHESETLANQVSAFMGMANSEYDDLYDAVLYNSGTLEDLKEMVKTNIQDWLSSSWIELEEDNGSNP
jgi:hypothetical protein